MGGEPSNKGVDSYSAVLLDTDCSSDLRSRTLFKNQPFETPTMTATNTPLTPCCGRCGSKKGLLRCSGCNVMQYCSRDHQVADRPEHKRACKLVQKNRDLLEREEQKLRAHPGDMFTPANVFESSIGHFWGIMETRDYMRARFALVEAILKIKAFAAVQSAFDHLRDMLRLCRSDNMGVRDLVPALLLRLGKDQESYDFVKWYATAGQASDYDWGDMSLPFLNVANADVFEPVDYMCRKYLNLSHTVAVTLLKIKVLLDLKDLQNSTELDKIIPQEVVDNIKRFLPRTTIISGDKDTMICTDHAARIEKLSSQVEKLYTAIKGYSPRFWQMLMKPGQHLQARPQMYSPKSMEEAQLVLQYSFDSWNETPGALEMIKAKIEG
jgi:hypothetical protein